MAERIVWMEENGKRILITGKNSYIGTCFAEYADRHYPDVFRIETISMRGGIWREKNLSEYDGVLHVAGIAHADVGHITEAGKQEYYRVNRDLTLELARKAKSEGVGQFVYISSMIVYGGIAHVTEATVPCPENFYGDSKWQADQGVRKLADTGFHVAVLRPPMIYGKGSKGNYPMLAGMAKKLPLFPKVKNQRSMLYIENLCEFLCHLMREGQGGIYFPQNKGTISTSDLVKEIANCCGHRIWVTPLLAPLVVVGRHLPGKIGNLCRKAFGSSYYDPDMDGTEGDYQVADWAESVRRTEQTKSFPEDSFPEKGTEV